MSAPPAPGRDDRKKGTDVESPGQLTCSPEYSPGGDDPEGVGSRVNRQGKDEMRD